MRDGGCERQRTTSSLGDGECCGVSPRAATWMTVAPAPVRALYSSRIPRTPYRALINPTSTQRRKKGGSAREWTGPDRERSQRRTQIGTWAAEPTARDIEQMETPWGRRAYHQPMSCLAQPGCCFEGVLDRRADIPRPDPPPTPTPPSSQQQRVARTARSRPSLTPPHRPAASRNRRRVRLSPRHRLSSC